MEVRGPARPRLRSLRPGLCQFSRPRLTGRRSRARKAPRRDCSVGRERGRTPVPGRRERRGRWTSRPATTPCRQSQARTGSVRGRQRRTEVPITRRTRTTVTPPATWTPTTSIRSLPATQATLGQSPNQLRTATAGPASTTGPTTGPVHTPELIISSGPATVRLTISTGIVMMTISGRES